GDEGGGRGEGASDGRDAKASSGAFAARITHAFNASLTRSLLRRHFGLSMPSLPEGRLCPPVPNRANYVCWLRELLARSEDELCGFAAAASGDAEGGDAVSSWRFRGMDIGTGVSAIYPLLLTTKLFASNDASAEEREVASRKWRFLATDTDPLAVQSARVNVEANRLEDQIHVVRVDDADSPLGVESKARGGPLFSAMEKAKHLAAFQPCCPIDGSQATSEKRSEYPKFDFVMTNPPFYSMSEEATAPRAGDKRSRTDMSANEAVFKSTSPENRDDGCDGDAVGGDVGFIAAIMKDSQRFRHHVTWYTSLLAKRSSLDAVLRKLQTLDGVWGNRGQIRTVEFRQGNIGGGDTVETKFDRHASPRVRWGIGWTYERSVGRCSECRVSGGLQSFDVWIGVGDLALGGSDAENEAKRTSDLVLARFVHFYENLRHFSLKCSQHNMREYGDGGLKTKRKAMCVTAVEERFFNCNATNPPDFLHDIDNDNLPFEGHFVIDSFVQSSGESNGRGDVRVKVVLDMYSHTTRGADVVNKIRGALPGEVGRTNRRWRRLLKRT
ncbi:hypothetical protein ACHAWF_018569, partial [Thalassiosira exigua]